jgi:hypothetical protein
MRASIFGSIFAAVALGLAMACVFGALRAVAQDVGNVGAANPRSIGTPPGSAERDLSIGDRVINKELIRTTAAGTAQVTFIDKTTLNIGRNSSVTIDKFVYDGQAGAGEFAATMSKGVMRFVGGQISHTSGATVNTPVATIGVRGGTMTIVFLGVGRVVVIAHYGVVDVSNAVSRQTILRPGYAVQVNGRNEAIGEAFPVPPELLADANARLTSRIGQRGGASVAPTDALAARYGIGTGTLAADPRTTPGLDTVGLINTGSTLVANRAQQQLINGRTVTITTTTIGAKQTTTSGVSGPTSNGGIVNSGTTIGSGTTISPAPIMTR